MQALNPGGAEFWEIPVNPLILEKVHLSRFQETLEHFNDDVPPKSDELKLVPW